MEHSDKILAIVLAGGGRRRNPALSPHRIIMDYAKIEKSGRLHRAIVDKHNVIAAGSEIDFDHEKDVQRYHVDVLGVRSCPEGIVRSCGRTEEPASDSWHFGQARAPLKRRGREVIEAATTHRFEGFFE